MAKFFLELSLVSYSMLAYLPSQVAASALYLARKILTNEREQWVRNPFRFGSRDWPSYVACRCCFGPIALGYL